MLLLLIEVEEEGIAGTFGINVDQEIRKRLIVGLHIIKIISRDSDIFD